MKEEIKFNFNQSAAGSELFLLVE